MKNIFEKLKNFLGKSGMFSKFIVIFCIVYSVHVIEWAMNSYEENPGLEPSTIITAALALFGGELLLLCLKRVFGDKDLRTKNSINDIKEIISDSKNDLEEEYDDSEIKG